RGGLRRAAERRDVDGVDALVSQPLRHPLGLDTSGLRQFRIPLAVQQRKRLVRPSRSGFPVPDQQDVGGTGRWGEAHLPVLHRRHTGSLSVLCAQISSNLPPDGAAFKGSIRALESLVANANLAI